MTPTEMKAAIRQRAMNAGMDALVARFDEIRDLMAEADGEGINSQRGALVAAKQDIDAAQAIIAGLLAL